MIKTILNCRTINNSVKHVDYKNKMWSSLCGILSEPSSTRDWSSQKFDAAYYSGSKPATVPRNLFGFMRPKKLNKSYNQVQSRLTIEKGCLYPKSKSPQPESQKELYDKYMCKQDAERQFKRLHAEITHIQKLIVTNPSLQSYYSKWIDRARKNLQEYEEIIESSDSISFSTVFGYSKDEDLITLYRHPAYSQELQETSRSELMIMEQTSTRLVGNWQPCRPLHVLPQRQIYYDYI